MRSLFPRACAAGHPSVSYLPVLFASFPVTLFAPVTDKTGTAGLIRPVKQSSTPLSEEEELHRVIPVLEAVKARFDVPISLDTCKAGVASEDTDSPPDLQPHPA